MEIVCPSATHLAISIAHKDHFLQQFAIGRCLRHDLPEQQQQLFDGVIMRRHHKADDWHQQAGQAFAVQQQFDDLLDGFDSHVLVTIL